MKVAIAGYGVEGAASCKYWLGLGASVTVFDERPKLDIAVPEGVDAVLGPDVFSHMDGYDLIIRTPGLNPSHIKTDGKIWSATNEFFKECPAQIIGVTGTKGKGTTCSLIAESLKAAGKTVHLLGNIGTPALEVLSNIQPEDIVVFELSSFQLWDVKKSPHIAVVLMVESDHQDVHEGMEDYVMAKANIGKFQSNDDIMVHHPTNENSLKIANLSKAQKQPYMTMGSAQIQNGKVVIEGNIICDVKEIGLLGVHNQENVCAAVTAVWNVSQDIQAIKTGIVEFKGLPHRLEFVKEVSGVRYYDDSQATGPASCVAALRALNDMPTVLILGGSDKGVDVSDVYKELDPNSHSVVLVGSSSGNLQTQLEKVSFRKFVNLGDKVTMPQIVDRATEMLGGSEGNVLLSPAHASFDMFKNYQDRGDQFKAAVLAL